MKIYKIGELCSFSKGASIPRDRMLQSGTINYLHYGDLYKGHNLYINIEDQETPIPFISSFEKAKDSQYAKDGDIVYVLTSETVEDLGKALLLQNPNHQIVVAGTETTIMHVDKKDIIEPAYLNYLLQTKCFKKTLQQYTTGMKVFRVHPRDISRIEIKVPNIEKQRAIIKILDQIHFKIRINNRINDYLAEIAIALFNKQCPQTKQLNAVLSNIAEITMGQSPVGSSYNEEGNGVVFYQGRAEFGSFFPRRRLFTTEPKRMAREGDTLMSVRAPVGDLNVANEDCCIGRGLAAIHSEGSQSFVHYLMRAQAKQLNSFNNNGTVFGSINGKALKELPVFLPSNDAIASLDSLLEPIDMLIRRNDDEIQALEQLRDALLPKLMSGEINVSEVEVPTQLNNHLQDYSTQSFDQIKKENSILFSEY